MRFKKYGDIITDPPGCSGEYDFKISWILCLLGCRIVRKLNVSECAHGIGCISGSRVTWRLITTVVVTTMSDHQAAKNTTPDQDLSRIPPRNIYLQVYKSLQKSLVAPPYRASQEHCRKTPAQTTIFPDSLQGISTAPCKIHRCSCTGHPKTWKKHEQNRTFSDTPLSPPGSKKHHRRPRFASNPSQE